MEQDDTVVTRTVLQLGEELGEVIPLSEIYKLLSDLNRNTVDSALRKLEGSGMISFLNRETISLNK
jgi:hypothetical protein